MRYIATGLINTGLDNFAGYRPEHEQSLRYDYGMVLDVVGINETAALEHVFTIGNRMAADTSGKRWPEWVRSLSVGDVVLLAGCDCEENGNPDHRGCETKHTAYACTAMGWDQVTIDLGGRWNNPGGRKDMAARGHARSVGL